MASEITLTIKDMSAGLRARLDEVNETAGSFRLLRNARITERGGIAKREGIAVIGDYDSSGSAVKGLFNYEKADGTKILVKHKGTVGQYLDTTWEEFETGLTASKTAYAPHVVNTENDDYLYLSSRDNGYKRWKGWFSRLTSALVGGETAVPVGTVLKSDVYYSGTAGSVTTTTVDMGSSTPWATDQWNGFYVRITSGASSGKISKISDTDNNTITFAAIAGLAGTPTFEIRLLNVPDTGTVLIGGTSTAYTAVSTDASLTVASAPAAADDSPVVLVATSYPAAPKGDALAVWLTTIFVADIKSAMAKDGSNLDIATAVSRAVYRSSAGDGTDFSFSAPRSADEGDILELAYGGGRVLDVVEQENKIYAGTPNYIEEIEYTQQKDVSGATDLADRQPLKPGIGLTGRFIKGKDDVYFFTPAGEFTSLGRVAQTDITPQSLDIGFPIRRLLVDRVNDEAVGLEWRNRIHIAQKVDENSTFNDRILVYNRGTKSFEGDWILPASALTIYNDKPAFGTSNGANAMQMYTGTNDVWNDVSYPISSVAKSNWINITASGMEDQALTGFHIEGFIRGNSAANFYLYSDYSDTPALTVNFSGTETEFQYSLNIAGALGELPLGEAPLGSVDEADADGLRRFRFSVWFPEIYCQAFSWGWQSDGLDEYVEANRVGVSVVADPLTLAAGLIKT